MTQGAVGAAVAVSVAPRERVLPAALAGAVAGMAPDLDVLIRSEADPLLALEYHRQLTHALPFAPFGALVCAVLLHRPLRGRLSFRVTYLYCLLGFASHGLLDACTSYGTRLWWPFADTRVAWHLVAVVDPLLTLVLLALLAAGLARRRPALARVACLWLVAYLVTGAVQQARVERAALQVAAARQHAAQALLVKPSFGNLLVWKSIYRHDGRYYVDALRAALEVTWFPGEAVAALDMGRDLPWLHPGSRQAADLERFRRFSDGYLALAPERPARVVDVRYSMVPNEIDPLWGIDLDRQHPQRPAAFFTDRRATAADRRALRDMLTGGGQPLPDPR